MGFGDCVKRLAEFILGGTEFGPVTFVTGPYSFTLLFWL